MSWLNASSRRKFSLGTIASPAEPEINLIPFIDVLLVVLIFLMISTTFTRFQELAITLPTANGNESQAEIKQIHIAVSRDGRFAVNGKVADRAQLSAMLSQMSNQGASSKETPSAMQVNIDADARAPHQAVMSALDMLSQMSNQGASSKEAPSAMQVNIDADARAPHQAVMSALEAARDANLSNIVFSSQTKK